jgi:serine/threonine-protein kinase
MSNTSRSAYPSTRTRASRSPSNRSRSETRRRQRWRQHLLQLGAAPHRAIDRLRHHRAPDRRLASTRRAHHTVPVRDGCTNHDHRTTTTAPPEAAPPATSPPVTAPPQTAPPAPPTTAAPAPASPPEPEGATAICNDGTYSYAQHRRGACSHHGGVRQWLINVPA